MKIGYLTFGRDDFSYGLSLCVSRITSEHDIYRVTPKTSRHVDVVLLSCFWWEHLYVMADFLRRAELPDSVKVVVGGFNTFNPVSLAEYVDAVIVGDGEESLPLLLSDIDGDIVGVYRRGSDSVAWQNVQPLKAHCHETNGIARIEAARGCRHKCRFCAVTHLKPYREVGADDIGLLLKKTRCTRVSLFAPEPTLHSDDKKLTRLCRFYGKKRQDSDVRLDRLEKRADSVPRIGLEGLSERLRKSVGKPYSNESIIRSVEQCIKDGRKGIFAYMILDLPGEEQSDWDEFRDTLNRIGGLPGAGGFLLKPSPSVFLPTPHTPMELEPIHWERPCGDMWRDFFGRGDSRKWGVLMAERSRVFSPAMRVLSMVATRAGVEFAEVEERLTRDRVISISGGRPVCRDLDRLLSALEPYGGVDRYCGVPRERPWSVVKIKTDK